MPISDLTAQLAETLTARIEALVLDAIALDGPVVDTARLNRVTDAKTHHERCHVLFMDTTRNTHWHPAWKPNGGKK